MLSVELSNQIHVLQVALSAFLGFGSALLVNYIVQWRLRERQKKRLLCVLKQELDNLQEQADFLEAGKVYIRPYSLPVWTGAVKSGHIHCLGDMSSFTLLLGVFSYIEEANLIEMECFKLANSSAIHRLDTLYAAVRESREGVKKQVSNGLSIIERQKV